MESLSGMWENFCLEQKWQKYSCNTKAYHSTGGWKLKRAENLERTAQIEGGSAGGRYLYSVQRHSLFQAALLISASSRWLLRISSTQPDLFACESLFTVNVSIRMERSNESGDRKFNFLAGINSETMTQK